MRQASGWILAILVAGCGGEELAGLDFEGMRAGGKADGYVDTSLTCEGSCGALATSATSYCGCDKLCTKYGDCCTDKAAVCDAAGATIITEAMNGTTQTIKVGEKIDVQLAGNPTTGYAWHLLASSKSFPLQKEEYVPSKPQLIGSGGTYHFYFTADTFSAGKVFTLSFSYYRSWEGVSKAIKTFTVKIAVTSSTKDCAQIDKDYQKELVAAGACKADSECDKFVGGNLTCGIPHKAINSALSSQVEAVKLEWQAAKCQDVDWTCPMLSPMPPWMAVRGVCEQGACKVEYYDTRGAKEGESCGDDINTKCGDGLYCAFGLNWCGTPPVTGVCRKMGDCGAVSDCDNADNSWIHPMCVGKATCTQGHCGWSCGL